MNYIRKHLLFFTLSLCLLIGGFLRFYNSNWDQGNYFHPDERNIAMAVSRISFFTHLDPEFFAYGGLPVYLYRAVGEGLILLTNDHSWVSEWGKINLIGRFFSALFSTLTIFPLFFLAKKVFSLKTAILTVVFYSFAVFSIQTAHFGVTESMITFFVVSIACTALYLFETPRFSLFLLLGALLGLALASKTAAISFFVYPSFLFFLLLFRHRKKKELSFSYLLRAGLAVGVTSILFFLLFSPFTILSWDKFSESMKYESGVVQGTLPVPYTLQFTGTPNYLFQLYNFLYQIGPLTLLLVLVPFVLWKEKKWKDPVFLLFISFPFMYFLYVGSWFTKFVRYMVPLLPFVLILISYTCDFLLIQYKRVGRGVFLFFYVTTFLWTFAFMHIYTNPQTRVKASEWIYVNIPPGASLAGEHWDDGLPISLGALSQSLYQTTALPIYDLHTPEDVEKLSVTLSKTDYIVLNSRRLYGTLRRLSEKYPYASSYYNNLFDEKLGFKKVQEFSSYPSVFGVTIPDDYSEETFQVYDHPKVIIFKKETNFSSEEIANKIIKP